MSALWVPLRTLFHDGLHHLRLGAPWSLLLLVLVVAAIVAAVLSKRRDPVLVFSRGEAVFALPRGRGVVLRTGARALVVVAAVLAALGAARPQLPGEPDPETTEGIDIVVALDVSGSMRAADFRPNDRLFVAKRVITEHLLSRKADRIGLIVFAGEAFTQSPLTHDKALLAEILSGVRTGVIVDGTAIGDGIATAVNRLRDSKAKTKVIILLTDGDNNSGTLAPDSATDLAVELSVKIFPILVGRGGRVPFPDGTDIFGAPRYVQVEMPTNPELLKRIAARADGTFFSATDPAALEGSFREILAKLDRSKLEGGPPVSRPIDLYPLLLLPAVLCLLAGLSLLVTRASPLP
jgi:Ca-activated chloride channel family protein